MQHHFTHNNVLYTPQIVRNLIFIAQARQNQFTVPINDNPRNGTCRRTDLYHKPLGKITMCGFETHEWLFKAVTRVCSNYALIFRTKPLGLYHRRLEHRMFVEPRESVEHVHGIKPSELKNIDKCETCELKKLSRVPRAAALYESREAAKPLEQVFLDCAGLMKHCELGRSRNLVSFLESYSSFSLLHFIRKKRKADEAEWRR